MLVICIVIIFYKTVLQVPDRILLSNGIVPVYKSINHALAANQPPKLAELKANQRVRLLKCVDVKHYYIYKIELDDGTIGFINEGDFTILRGDQATHC